MNNLQSLKIVQINVGLGKAATELTLQKATQEKTDIILIQEPFTGTTANHILGQNERYSFILKGKTETLNNNCIKGIIIVEHTTTNNYITKSIEDNDKPIKIINIYDEPGGK